MIFYGFTDRLPEDPPEQSEEESIYEGLTEFDPFDWYVAFGRDADTLQGIMQGTLVPDPSFI